MAGFDCKFMEPPPDIFAAECPICLLILREPYQANYCGKNFCKTCLEVVKIAKQPCLYCKVHGFFRLWRQKIAANSVRLSSALLVQDQRMWVERRTQRTRRPPQQESVCKRGAQRLPVCCDLLPTELHWMWRESSSTKDAWASQWELYVTRVNAGWTTDRPTWYGDCSWEWQ